MITLVVVYIDNLIMFMQSELEIDYNSKVYLIIITMHTKDINCNSTYKYVNIDHKIEHKYRNEQSIKWMAISILPSKGEYTRCIDYFQL